MEYEKEGKRGHGTLALILGIGAIVISVLVGIMFGMFGVVPGLILAVLAIVLGIMSMRATMGRSGKGGLIVGIIALVLAGMVGGITMVFGSFLKSDEIKKNVPILAEYADESWRGVVGVFIKMNEDGVDFDEMTRQMNAFTSGETGTASAQSEQVSQAATE